MKRLAIGVAVLAVILALGIGTAGAADPISGGVVKIGVLSDMSGPYATVGGKWTVAAVQMAIDDYGGKVLGKPIELVLADHQNNPGVGSTIARKWIDEDGVDMITGLDTSSVGLAVQHLASAKHTITMNVGSGTTQLTGAQCTKYGIGYAYDTYALPVGTATAVVKAGGKTWFFITANYAFGHSLQKNTTEVVDSLGGKVLGSALEPLGTNDFASALLQAKASGAQVIALANAGKDTVNAIKQAQQFEIGPAHGQKVVGMLVIVNTIRAVGLKAAQGLEFATAFYWDRNAETRKWSERYFKKTGRMPNFLQAGAYSAVTTYLNAIKAAGTDNGGAVRAELGKMKIHDFFAADGVIQPDGRMQHDMYLVRVKKPSQSHGPWDLLQVVATIPGDVAFPLSKSACPLLKE